VDSKKQKQMIGGLFLFLSFFLPTSGSKYCASIDSSTASGASGYFSMQIFPGKANYSFFLDLTHFDTGTCDLSIGLSYHIHTYWTNTSVTSSANSFCGAAYAGGHYDPNLACGPNSQDANGLCVNLGRTATSTPPYSYSCNPSNYQSGRYAFCELGDFSNKFGFSLADSGTRIFQQSTPLADYQPPYEANYKQGDAVSYQWQSIVFHCGQTNTRLVCAEFLEIDDGDECGASSKSKSDDDEVGEWATGEWNSLAKLLVGLTVGLVVVGSIVGVIIWRQRSSGAMNSDSDRSLLNQRV
jgi:hypothetical protein